MKFVKWVLVIVISIGALYSYAQTNTRIEVHLDESEYDTSYIESYRDYLVISLVTVRNSNDITINDNFNNDIIYSLISEGLIIST